MSSSTRSRKVLKGCVRLVIFLGFIRFMMVEAHHHHQEERIRGFGGVVTKKLEVSGKVKQDFVEAVKRKKHKLEINYTNKRRVPNGPDPIHNRGAGKSNRPPGHA